MSVEIRPETPHDIAAIHAVTEMAFRDMPYSDGDEHHLVDRLRADGDLTLSLVALASDTVVGHIAFSPVAITDGSQNWFGLGPVSVRPDWQGEGIGSALIVKGIETMRADGAQGIVLLGSDTFYPRFGFSHDPRLRYPGPPARYFQQLSLSGDAPKGDVHYAKAFG